MELERANKLQSQQFLETLKQMSSTGLIESIDLNELPFFGYSDFIIRGERQSGERVCFGVAGCRNLCRLSEGLH